MWSPICEEQEQTPTRIVDWNLLDEIRPEERNGMKRE